MAGSDTERQGTALGALSEGRFVLRLYIAGATLESQRAVHALSEILEDELPGRHVLDVIDIYQRPELAISEQIVATPTLMRVAPEPLRQIVGDMSDRERVRFGLGIGPRPVDIATTS